MMRTEDAALSTIAAAVTVLLGWQVVTREELPRGHRLPPSLEMRVTEIAEAVAIAEGYYAPGDHDGHSLPYLLNNPGGLKKPALGAAALPTWRDTGLVQFPTSEMGWAALRHQLRGMLSGASRIYDPSDTWLHVADKYADGDLNWGLNVAAELGVTPTSTLKELASGR
jgi:hypothetical protein